MKLLLLADDFTGALDTGVQLSLKGVPTYVAASAEEIPLSVLTDCQVLSINCEIRHASPKNAYNCMRGLLEKYATPGTYVYIKTDSALRGNLAASMAAALDTIGGPIAFVPAFPALGRTTRNAVCYIDGQPLEQSVFKDDPRTPMHNSYIPDLLASNDYPFTCSCVPYERLEQFDVLQKEQPGDVYLFDCETNEQLSKIGQALASRSMYGLTAGCAGFASTFERHLPLSASTQTPPLSPGPVLYVSGSANAVTLAQLSYAKEHDFPVLSLADMLYACYQNTTNSDNAHWKIFEAARKKLRNGQSVILATAASREELRQIPDPVFHETVAKQTSNLVQLLLDEVPISTLAVFGGDMVAAILKQLSCPYVRAWGEIRTGVPLCTFSYRGRTQALVTKSGGFGAPDVIPAINDYFQQQF